MTKAPIATLTLFVIAAVCPVRAEDLDKLISRCAAVSGDPLRLQCYDDIARSRDLVPRVETSRSPEGNWDVQIESNPIDDSKVVWLAVHANNVTGGRGKPVLLVLRCWSGRTTAYIAWNEYLGSGVRVTSRIGNAKATTEQWILTSDSRASFVPGNAIEFIRRLAAVPNFVAQVTPYQKETVTATFDVSGLSEAVKPLAQTCGWK